MTVTFTVEVKNSNQICLKIVTDYLNLAKTFINRKANKWIQS